VGKLVVVLFVWDCWSPSLKNDLFLNQIYFLFYEYVKHSMMVHLYFFLRE